MTNNMTLTPYYPLQHLLREFSKALGTKSIAAKKIDDACKNLEINPFHLENLKQELIHEPITKYVNIHFADHLLSQFNRITEIYLNLMQLNPLDGVDALKARELIDRFFMPFAIAEFCLEMLDAMKLTTKFVASSNIPLMPIALENLNHSGEWRDFELNASEQQKERLRIWRSGIEIPELHSIAALGEKSVLGNSWGTLKARLITARVWDYFFNRNGKYNSEILKNSSMGDLLDETQHQLFSLQGQMATRYKETSFIGLSIARLLRLREPGKTKETQNKCQKLLEELNYKLVSFDTRQEASYYYYWMQARYYLHNGELEAAIDRYKIAFEQVIYRETTNTKKIIQESIIAACRCSKPDKRFINRLRRMAVILKIDFMPAEHSKNEFKVKPEEIEEWEIAAFSQFYDSFFTRESMFTDAPYPNNPHKKFGYWFFDETDYQLDLKKTNKMFSVGKEGTLIKEMPQLVYFAMQNNIKAISALLDAGADVNKLSSSYESAILMAIQRMEVNDPHCRSMDDNVFNLLSQKPHHKSVLNTLTLKRKLSPLGCAVNTGRPGIVEKLLKMGAFVDNRDGIDGTTPLYTCLSMIANHTRADLKKILLENMKYSDAALQASRAYSAGIFPHDLNHLKQILKEQRANETFKDFENAYQDAHFEFIKKHSKPENFRKIAKLLIEYGADPNAKHDTAMLGYTPLLLAIELDEDEIVASMLNAKVKANLNDTCIDSITNRRINILSLIRNWRSYKVAKILAKKEILYV